MIHGVFLVGRVKLVAPGSPVKITSDDLVHRVLSVRGWASTNSDMVPGLVTSNYRMWSGAGLPLKEAWVVVNEASGLDLDGVLRFDDKLSVDIEIRPGGARFILRDGDPATAPSLLGKDAGYGFQFSWQ